MRHIGVAVLSLWMISWGLWACGGKKAESRNIEQIYDEKGVPVRVVPVQPKLFEVRLAYHAVLTGIEESSAHALVSDKVEKIFVHVGDHVKRGQVLLAFPTDNPSARYYQAKVAYENARTAYQRVENLYQTGGISRQDLDNARTNYEVARANWEAAEQAVKVRAPISGDVTKVNVHESDHVKFDKELFTISKTEKLKAKVWVAESEIQQVREGLPARATWNDSTISGQVVQVDMAMNQKMQGFGAVIEFDNPHHSLICGVTADIVIETYRNPAAIVVERKNIFQEQNHSYVYVLRNGLADKREVKPGRQEGTDVEIEEGLVPGDTLIVEGQLLLEDGKKVKIID